jgi:hypothetical protein
VPTPDGGAIIVESTPIPSTKISQQETPVPYQVVSDGKAVAKDENRTRKIVVRVLSGALMVSRCKCMIGVNAVGRLA